jgi:hypothetical protein
LHEETPNKNGVRGKTMMWQGRREEVVSLE